MHFYVYNAGRLSYIGFQLDSRFSIGFGRKTSRAIPASHAEDHHARHQRIGPVTIAWPLLMWLVQTKYQRRSSEYIHSSRAGAPSAKQATGAHSMASSQLLQWWHGGKSAELQLNSDIDWFVSLLSLLELVPNTPTISRKKSHSIFKHCCFEQYFEQLGTADLTSASWSTVLLKNLGPTLAAQCITALHFALAYRKMSVNDPVLIQNYLYNISTSWRFQPIWKIWVKLDHFPNFRVKIKDIWVATTQSKMHQ